MRIIAALVSAGLLTACASSGNGQETRTYAPPRQAEIVAADGRPIGRATLTEGPSGVLIRLEFQAGALPAGWHGLHLHASGNCSDAAQGFHASGGHAGMAAAIRHGLLNPEGPEDGDLPNIYAPAAGPFSAEVFSSRVSLSGVRSRSQLLDADGAALIVHAQADDQQSQPIGGAGARIACAAINPG